MDCRAIFSTVVSVQPFKRNKKLCVVRTRDHAQLLLSSHSLQLQQGQPVCVLLDGHNCTPTHIPQELHFHLRRQTSVVCTTKLDQLISFGIVVDIYYQPQPTMQHFSSCFDLDVTDHVLSLAEYAGAARLLLCKPYDLFAHNDNATDCGTIIFDTCNIKDFMNDKCSGHCDTRDANRFNDKYKNSLQQLFNFLKCTKIQCIRIHIEKLRWNRQIKNLWIGHASKWQQSEKCWTKLSLAQCASMCAQFNLPCRPIVCQNYDIIDQTTLAKTEMYDQPKLEKQLDYNAQNQSIIHYLMDSRQSLEMYVLTERQVLCEMQALQKKCDAFCSKANRDKDADKFKPTLDNLKFESDFVCKGAFQPNCFLLEFPCLANCLFVVPCLHRLLSRHR